MKKYFLLFFTVLLVACSPKKEMQTINFEGFVFGTTYHITLQTDLEFDYQKSIDSLFFLVNKST